MFCIGIECVINQNVKVGRTSPSLHAVSIKLDLKPNDSCTAIDQPASHGPGSTSFEDRLSQNSRDGHWRLLDAAQLLGYEQLG